MSLRETLSSVIEAHKIHKLEFFPAFNELINPILKTLLLEELESKHTIDSLTWDKSTEDFRIQFHSKNCLTVYYISKEIIDSEDPVKAATIFVKEQELKNIQPILKQLEQQRQGTLLQKKELEKELTELRGWKYNPKIPYSVREITDQEFEAETQKMIDSGFPDLAPCCKREYREGGWCLNCGSPGF